MLKLLLLNLKLRNKSIMISINIVWFPGNKLVTLKEKNTLR